MIFKNIKFSQIFRFEKFLIFFLKNLNFSLIFSQFSAKFSGQSQNFPFSRPKILKNIAKKDLDLPLHRPNSLFLQQSNTATARFQREPCNCNINCRRKSTTWTVSATCPPLRPSEVPARRAVRECASRSCRSNPNSPTTTFSIWK